MKIVALIMIVASGVGYQICSKAIPSEVNPFVPLLCTYAIAFITALLLCLCTHGTTSLLKDLKKVNAFCFVLGAIICFYELGFLLAYRNGFSLTTLPPIANILVIVAVCVVGVLFFKEKITLQHLCGLILAVGGIAVTIIK